MLGPCGYCSTDSATQKGRPEDEAYRNIETRTLQLTPLYRLLMAGLCLRRAQDPPGARAPARPASPPGPGAPRGAGRPKRFMRTVGAICTIGR